MIYERFNKFLLQNVYFIPSDNNLKHILQFVQNYAVSNG
jgi:hypothetical protein